MAVVNNAAERQTVTNYILINLVIISKARFDSTPRNHSASSANVCAVRCFLYSLRGIVFVRNVF